MICNLSKRPYYNYSQFDGIHLRINFKSLWLFTILILHGFKDAFDNTAYKATYNYGCKIENRIPCCAIWCFCINRITKYAHYDIGEPKNTVPYT